MWFKRKISKAAEMLIWLHQTDPGGWKRGTYAKIHKASGVGVWIGNKDYGLHVEYNCDPMIASSGGMAGIKIEMDRHDRKALWKEFGPHKKYAGGPVIKAIFEWSMRNKCTPKKFEDAA